MLDPITLLSDLLPDLHEGTIAFKIVESVIWHLVLQDTALAHTHYSLGTVRTFWRIYAETRNTLPS
jgi:hypothetical protein